jgi:CHAD domain-containing protein
LDVYLLNEQTYKNILPVQFRKNISELFDQLKEKRQSAYQDFAAVLNSDRYKKIMIDWIHFLNTKIIDIKTATKAVGQPVVLVVKPIILNQLEIVLNLGNQINEETEDKKVHDLRLECKKLRYLLEFFASLFPKKRMDTFIDHLKILQDNLGKFNDYSVQQNFLQGYLKQHIISDENDTHTIAGIGALIGILYDKQMQTRREFSIRYAQFASKENITIAMKMFKS